MEALFTVIVMALVVLVLALVAFALYELSPARAEHNQFRDPRTGKRIGESPHLD